MVGVLKTIKNFKYRFQENSCSNLLWILNILPTIAGFPLLSKKFNVIFWAIHNILLFYVCIVGIIVYQIYYARDFIDSMNSFFNLSIFIVIFNSTWWRQCKRADLNYTLELALKNDELIIDSGRFIEKYIKYLKRIKIVVVACHIFHFVNDICIYIPTRICSVNSFAVASCVGMEPLTSSPNRESCMLVLAFQELTAATVVCSYDATLLFLFSHTTAVFRILAKDVSELNNIAIRYDSSSEMKTVITDRLNNVIIRHSSVLYTVKKIQDLYSATIGIGFGLNAISICLFFVLPIEVCFNFAPLIYHGIFVFLLYCYQGQRLTNASEKFEQAVYACGWERFNVDMRKCVLLILKQAQKPVMTFAAGVIPIRLYTFACTMQNIYKLVTVFKL